jgi:formylglycine-generating enzyme required for sulfatase activity/energy-coupling factor transporter ATP-binding protein EcfA2
MTEKQELPSEYHGQVSVSADGRINGVAVGVNLGRIVYGREPEEDERRRLAWYLANLTNKLVQLPLQGIDANLEHGAGIALPQIYTEMALQGEYTTVAQGQWAEVHTYFQLADNTKEGYVHFEYLRPEYHPTWAIPSKAITWVDTVTQRLGENRPLSFRLERQQLVTEAIQVHGHLVVLGDPGSGKSTFLRHLAWALAQRGLDQLGPQTTLTGWNDGRRLLPVLLPLRSLAGRLASDAARSAEQHVHDALLDEIEKLGIYQLSDALTEALVRGKVLLLFDGLDEVPPDGAEGVASRIETLEALRAFCRLYPHNSAVITCRTLAFDQELREVIGWQVVHLAPFTMGQIRHFVPAWYRALGGKLQPGQATLLSERLISTIEQSHKLREFATSPLLLTMMAIVLMNKGELPRDRPLLYEAVLELLLGQWDAVRDGQTLGKAIGLPDWGSDRFRRLLDKLSYDAHKAATSEDGRGRLQRGDMYDELIEFFKAARVANPGDAAVRWLEYIEQRSGLLAPDDNRSYVFVHLTLQEHCAGRYMLLNRSAATLVAQHRIEDRWREPILLGLGVVQQNRPELIERILTDLIDTHEKGQPKEIDRWYRDLIFAAEIGKDRDWDYLRTQEVEVDRLQRGLRQGLVALLQDTSQPLPANERILAGELLGHLGDPRFPVTFEEWRRELSLRNQDFGAPAGYWCYVRPGTYQIGDRRHALNNLRSEIDTITTQNEDHHIASIDLPAFWIARYPITVAQFEPFVKEGYGSNGNRWWTPDGWQWKQKTYRTEPWLWKQPPYNRSNQPVIGVSWYEAVAFCAWLTEQLAETLPEGYQVRLPTDVEWEAAAAFDSNMQQHVYPWGKDEPTPELAIYEASNLDHPASVGSCPAGMAACGALDLAGNVWEYIENSRYNDRQSYWHGGSWKEESRFIGCMAESWNRVDDSYNDKGFRVVLAPKQSR